MKRIASGVFLLLFLSACQQSGSRSKGLTIFFVNDVHGQLDNFGKVKYILDSVKQETNVLVVSAGDIFSGNPIVDQYDPKGYPIIDIMNRVGFDVSVLGNHEFDYGIEILDDRIKQSSFPWICANVNTNNSALNQPEPHVTLNSGNVKVTFVGLVETNGKPNEIIPSTHPWRVQDLTFVQHETVLDNYTKLKAETDSDLIVALTHLGSGADERLASSASYFDIIIGGHTNDESIGATNGIPTLMAGHKLSHLGRIDLEIIDEHIVDWSAELIDLDTFIKSDNELTELISSYNENPAFDEVIGHSASHLNRAEVGCFYVTAMREYFDADVAMQNSGGVRAELDSGPISVLEIYNIDPFNNGSAIFTWTVKELESFLEENEKGIHFIGAEIRKGKNGMELVDSKGIELPDDQQITIAINDYIPSVYDEYFLLEEAEIPNLTTAEVLIRYVSEMNDPLEFEGCNSRIN